MPRSKAPQRKLPQALTWRCEPDAGVLDDRIAERQPIPMKWHRFSLELGEFRFDCHDPAARDAASAAFTARVLEQARAVLGAWIDSPEGQRDAYRPNERILPSNFANKASWERYLDALRQRRPAVLADILPDLTGVALVLDAAPDFVDPSRVNLRAAVENGAQVPSRQMFADFEPSLFQVGLQLTLACGAASAATLGPRSALLSIQGLAHLSRHGAELRRTGAALGGGHSAHRHHLGSALCPTAD